MRTYKRKRQEHSYIEDVCNMCRLCLKKTKESVPIFTNNTNVCASLALRIMICVGVEVPEDECLPNMICTECYEELNKYYSFRKKCALTYQKLKSHVLAVKDMQCKKNAFNTLSNNNVPEDVANPESIQNAVVLKENNISTVTPEENKVDIDDMRDKLNGVSEIKVLNDELDNDLKSSNVSEFLTAILLKLGFLVKQDDLFIVTNLNQRTLELETADGCQITLELIEKVEEEPIVVNKKLFQNISYASDEDDSTNTAYRQENLEDPRPACAECGKRFATRTVLRRHARVHTGERPFACRHCPRRFAQREVLRRHELVHAARRPHACARCPKSFTQRGALAAHARSHEPRALTLHRCARCPKLFLHASGLSRHMAMHAGRIFICPSCSSTFRDKCSLQRHRSRAHPAEAAQGAEPGGAQGQRTAPAQDTRAPATS